MRTWLIALALVAVITAPASAQQKIDIRRAAERTVSVRLSGAIAAVKVIGWERDSIALTGAVGAGSRLEGGPRNMTGPVNGMKFFVEAPDEASLAGNRLELRVPRAARVWIKVGSAEIDVSGVTGGLDLNVVGGSVTVAGKPSELIVESMDGRVTVNASAEYARLKTATGDIAFEGAAQDISATTVSGAVTITGGAIERGRFESVTGPITFAADMTRGAELRFDTHSGAVDLRFTRGTNFEIDVATVTGTIENRWSAARPGVGREGRGMDLGISSGTGGGRVSVRSFKGNVRLSAK